MTNDVESYAEMARALWTDPASPHGYEHSCLVCADLRYRQRRILPVLIVAGRAIPTLPMGRRRHDDNALITTEDDDTDGLDGARGVGAALTISFGFLLGVAALWVVLS